MRWESEYAGPVSSVACTVRFTRRARRTTRFALHCEPLETRQLLSIGQTGLAAGVLLNPSAASAADFRSGDRSPITTPPSYLTIEIEFGTYGGLNQIQIIFSAAAPVFSPTPASSSGGSGSGLGTLSGTSGNSNSAQRHDGIQSFSSSTDFQRLDHSAEPEPDIEHDTNTPGAPVYLVPPPLAPLAVHLGPSAAPATTINRTAP